MEPIYTFQPFCAAFNRALSFSFVLTTTLVSCRTLTPPHLAAMASSIQGHDVVSTFSRTKSSSALAPGAADKMASAPTRGMCSVEERRASVDVARDTSRVGCAFVGVEEAGLRVDK
jgi:hypothetical protein